jgi:hypothetical protein
MLVIAINIGKFAKLPGRAKLSIPQSSKNPSLGAYTLGRSVSQVTNKPTRKITGGDSKLYSLTPTNTTRNIGAMRLEPVNYLTVVLARILPLKAGWTIRSTLAISTESEQP